MKAYFVNKTDQEELPLDCAAWQQAARGEIASFPWKKEFPYRPKTFFWILASDAGLHIRLQTDEKPLLARYTEDHSPVCRDSCMEFFIEPFEESPHYCNLEVNPNGTLLLGKGTGRHDRQAVWADREIFQIRSMVTDDLWTLCFFVPFSFLEEQFGGRSRIMRGNLYKCGDDTVHPHYGVWSPIEGIDQPDFHRPEFFGEFLLP